MYALLFAQRVSEEPGVTNVLKFDFLLPEIVLAKFVQVFLVIHGFLSILWNLDLIMFWKCAQYIFLKSDLNFDIETIAGCQLIRFFPKSWKVVTDLRKKLYCTHCQNMVLWYWEDIKDVQKNLYKKQFLTTKYQISNHLCLLKLFRQREGHTGQPALLYSYLKILKSS